MRVWRTMPPTIRVPCYYFYEGNIMRIVISIIKDKPVSSSWPAPLSWMKVVQLYDKLMKQPDIYDTSIKRHYLAKLHSLLG